MQNLACILSGNGYISIKINQVNFFMDSVFYLAAIITVLASIKVVSCMQAIKALLYFIVSLLSSSVVFVILGAYFSAALEVILFIGAVSLLFLLVFSITGIRQDSVETNKRGISPKIWLGPLLLAFILLVALLYGIMSTDYDVLQPSNLESSSVASMLLNEYILVIELAVLLLLGALVITYHFMHQLPLNVNSTKNEEVSSDE